VGSDKAARDRGDVRPHAGHRTIPRHAQCPRPADPECGRDDHADDGGKDGGRNSFDAERADNGPREKAADSAAQDDGSEASKHAAALVISHHASTPKAFGRTTGFGARIDLATDAERASSIPLRSISRPSSNVDWNQGDLKYGAARELRTFAGDVLVGHRLRGGWARRVACRLVERRADRRSSRTSETPVRQASSSGTRRESDRACAR
jgi:hypothetical protein